MPKKIFFRVTVFDKVPHIKRVRDLSKRALTDLVVSIRQEMFYDFRSRKWDPDKECGSDQLGFIVEHLENFGLKPEEYEVTFGVLAHSVKEAQKKGFALARKLKGDRAFFKPVTGVVDYGRYKGR